MKEHIRENMRQMLDQGNILNSNRLCHAYYIIYKHSATVENIYVFHTFIFNDIYTFRYNSLIKYLIKVLKLDINVYFC